MGIMAPAIWYLALLGSVTFIQCTVAGQEPSKTCEDDNSASKPVVRFDRATDFYELLPNGLTPSQMLDTSEGFLAGENTPVFLASKRPGKPVIYTKVHNDFVKTAVDWWLSSSNNNRVYGNVTLPSKSTQDVLYPSVLAVLDYNGGIMDNNQGLHETWIKEGILYALSFWYGFDLQLRYLSNPEVRIRLAGIVLGKNREATPYIYENQDDGAIDAEQLIVPMMAYWRNLGKTNQDFNPMAFDTVATMTQMSGVGQWDDERPDPTAADTRSICSSRSKAINGLIVHDNLAYAGLQPAVHSMARIFGATRGENPGCNVNGSVMEPSYKQTVNGYGKKWAACTLAEISNYLSEHGSCMTSPKEYHKPGKPVPAILPGKFQTIKDQCGIMFPDEKLYDCFADMKDAPCGELICAPDIWNHGCRSTDTLVPEGSSCDVGFSGNGQKICLDGKCVRDPTPH